MFSIGLAEVVLLVKDVQAAARFYREVVGLVTRGRRITSGPGSGLVSRGGISVLRYTRAPCSLKSIRRFLKDSALGRSTTPCTCPLNTFSRQWNM
jgi:hypothetical protein